MRGAFVVGLMAGAALGALIVLAAQENNRKIIVVQAGRLADQAKSLINRGTCQVQAVANDAVDAAAEMVADAVGAASEMA